MKDQKTVKSHIMMRGMDPGYITWFYHGELRSNNLGISYTSANYGINRESSDHNDEDEVEDEDEELLNRKDIDPKDIADTIIESSHEVSEVVRLDDIENEDELDDTLVDYCSSEEDSQKNHNSNNGSDRWWEVVGLLLGDMADPQLPVEFSPSPDGEFLVKGFRAVCSLTIIGQTPVKSPLHQDSELGQHPNGSNESFID
ncbi:pyridoxal-5'-phosphate-dependent enzyme family protein [Striga asiatica]|uniref:Pyridoxal-5'-phosphate-dependent enzyme family protein n=1 Tax=Striga asiatica TaxID=4170 RepID=A0A5A7QET7_STRAF|nr:pyridoxal-5'-phosphate-dependent enzyme family protein [Striga asiatica]